jgi:uncharacterized coiled-coil protein SlyX
VRWRRRSSSEKSDDHTTLALVPAPRVERALVALAVQTQRLDDRIDRLERRLVDQQETTEDLPTHADVMDVRLHSARVAAELARVAVELRAEIEKRMAEAHPPPTPRDRRLAALAETIIDLSDGFDTQPSDLGRAATA